MDELLIIFGFGWMVISALIGLALGARHEPHVASLEELARQGELVAYHRALDKYKWRVTVHAHGMLFALVSIVVGLVLARTTYSPLTRDGIAVAMALAAVIWTIGGFRSIKALMGIGDLLFVAGIVATLIGLTGIL